MNDRVLRIFTHDHNAAEVAGQEWELARQDYDEAIRQFEPRLPSSVAKLEAASDRRNAAWAAWWALTRGD